MKNKVLKVFTIFLLLTIFVGQFDYFSFIAADAPANLEFVYEKDNEYPFTESGRNVFYRQATLGERAAYCIDYGRTLPKDDNKTGYVSSLSWKGYMSGEALAVLVYGYPNNVTKEFEVKGQSVPEASYLVTQVAFWEVMKRTGEGNSRYDIDIDSIVANAGYEDVVAEIKANAKALADAAMRAPYNVTPVANIDTSSYNIVDENDKKVAGPYKIVGEDGTNKTNFTVTNITASLLNAPSSAVIVDKNRNPKTTFSLGEEIYVMADKSDTSANFNLSVNVSGDFLKCSVYGVSDASKQNFATITTEPITLAPYVNITWSKDTGNIVIIKEDQENEKIEDVVFEIRDSSGQKIAEATTNSNGRIDLSNIPTGKYSIKEISAPAGYVMDTTSRSVTVTSGSTVTETYSNTKKSGILIINKVDQYDEPIEDVTFTIYDNDGNVVEKIVTDEDGRAESSELDIGNYTYMETNTPDDVEADRTKYRFTIKNYNDVVTRNIVNNRIIDTPKTAKIRILKKDQNGNPIEGVKFTIYTKDDVEIQNMYTDENGIALSGSLELGKYIIKETSVPSDIVLSDETYKYALIIDGQVLKKEIVNERIKATKGEIIINKIDQYKEPIENVEFTLYKADDDSVVGKQTTDANGVVKFTNLENGRYKLKETKVPSNVTANPKEIVVEVTDAQKVITKNIQNTRTVDEPQYGALKIIKTDEDGKYLEGVKFEIYDINGKKVDTIETNKNGESIISKLEVGTYYYKEIDSGNDALRLDATVKEFEISTNSVTVQNVVNEYKTGGLKIIKVDQSKNPIPGVTFKIYDKDKNEIDTLVTDSSGVTNTSKELRLGTYYYKEVSAPANVEMNTEMHEFEVKNDGQIIEFNVKNNIIQGKLKIVKLDNKNNPLKGVRFEILDSNKQVIETVETDENGFAITKTLAKGTYYYREIKTLDAYVLDSTEHEFKIDSETDFVEEKVTNKLKSAKLIINKFSKEDNTPLKDIRFEIIDSNNNIIQSIVTDENGRAESDTLTYGTYYYREVSSPDDHILDSTLHEFEIKEDNVNVEKNVYNEKKKLPVTGSIFSTDVIIVIIIAVSCVVLYVLIKMIIAYISNKNNNW